MYPNSLQDYSKHQFSIREIKLIDHFIKQNFLYLSRKKDINIYYNWAAFKEFWIFLEIFFIYFTPRVLSAN